MRSVIKTSIFSAFAATTFSLPLAAQAGGFGYESTIAAPQINTVKLDVRLSEDLAYRANNLPKKLRDRGNARGLNEGFAGNGFYGDKELNRLTERLSEKVSSKLEKNGFTVSDEATTTLIVTLDDVKPNRPTFEQLSRQPSLSFQSFAVGGAEIKSELVDSSGNSLGTADYRWFENDIRFANFGGTWQDANRAIGRFASRISKDLAEDQNNS